MWSGAYQTGTTITFPVAFGTCYSVLVTSIHNSTSSSYCDYIDRVLSYTNTDVNIYVNTSSFFWISVGKAQQWGVVHTRTTTVEFNIPFTKVFACVGTNTSSVGNAVPSCGITNLTNSSFTMSVFANDNVGTSDVTWMALGA